MRGRLAPRFAAAGLGLSLVLASVLALSPLVPTTLALAQTSQRDQSAEQYVQTQAQRALGILAGHGKAEKIRAFRAFVDQVADVPAITHFVLGKYNRTITPDQYQRFAAAFREYASNIYETRLDDYHGETLKVTGSVVRKPGDVIVTSQITGGAQPQPISVRWRVIRGAAGWKVVDVEVKGIWLAITEEQDFVSTIDNAQGNVDVLIAQLQKRNRDPASTT
jgi:phospholipid transport system substrate-binding protein